MRRGEGCEARSRRVVAVRDGEEEGGGDGLTGVEERKKEGVSGGHTGPIFYRAPDMMNFHFASLQTTHAVASYSRHALSELLLSFA
jgi:hypothetical protein